MKTTELTVRISVIVPVWNPGLGISRCIDSLRNQTLKDIEIIFVDDCGTDDSMDRVYDAAKEDLRIRSLRNTNNIGVGASRNRGLEAARGEYISFVDPDDYVATDFLEILYREACREAVDIVKGTVILEAKDGPRLTKNLNQVIRGGIAQEMPLFLLFTYEHQSAIYRRQFLLTNNVRYGKSHRAQDHVFLLQACHAANSIAVNDEANYYFCERDNSAMHNLDVRSLQGCADAVADQIDYVLKKLPHNQHTELFLINLFNVFLREYERYDCISDMKEEASHYLDRLRSELSRIPYCENLTEHSYSLRVLRDYGSGLPMAPYFSPWEDHDKADRYARLIKRWSDFYNAHPEEKEACKDVLTKIYIRARQDLDHY